MEVEHDDPDLLTLETDRRATAGHGDAVDRAYRKVMQVVRAAVDERDLYKHKSLNFKKRQGGKTERSMRLNKQWRLFVELRGTAPNKKIGIMSIEDRH